MAGQWRRRPLRPAEHGRQTAALLQGDTNSNLVALDPATGTPLWHAGLHASMTNGPITYQLDGVQYLVVAASDTLYGFAMHAN